MNQVGKSTIGHRERIFVVLQIDVDHKICDSIDLSFFNIEPRVLWYKKFNALFMYAIAIRPSICYSRIVHKNGLSTVYLRQHTEKYVHVNKCFVHLRHYISNSTQKQQLVYQYASLAQKSLHSLISCNKCHMITSSFWP